MAENSSFGKRMMEEPPPGMKADGSLNIVKDPTLSVKTDEQLPLVLPVSSDELQEEADQYLSENDQNDHMDTIEDYLDQIMTLAATLLVNATSQEPLRKAWSEEARAAAAEARSHSNRVRNLSQQHTGLKHAQMNRSGFIKVQSIDDPMEQRRGRDYNNARAQMLKARYALGDAILGTKPGNLKDLANAYHQSNQRVKAAGAYYRISKGETGKPKKPEAK